MATEDFAYFVQRWPSAMVYDAEPGCSTWWMWAASRFHALYDMVYRRDVLEHAWVQVRRTHGATGIDWIIIVDVEESGVSPAARRTGRGSEDQELCLLPAHQVLIPKRGSGERRPVSTSSVRDRIVQTAIKIVLEPIQPPAVDRDGAQQSSIDRLTVWVASHRTRLHHDVLTSETASDGAAVHVAS